MKVTVRPPRSAQVFARKGFDAREAALRSKKCCTRAGMTRAHSILRGEQQDAVDIRGWFRRHEGYYRKARARAVAEGRTLRQAAPDEPAIQAWWIWGGDPMWAAAEDAVARARRGNPELMRVPSQEALCMRVDRDRFVHFTTAQRALEIARDRKLKLYSPYDPFGPRAVYAVSLVYGAAVPQVQLTHLPEDEPLAAIVFRTRAIPKIGFVEEVVWEKDVPIRDTTLVPVSQALAMLKNTPETIGDQQWVRYDCRAGNPDLPLMEVDEAGFRFETGVPVSFDFLRGTESAPYFGAQYQQDIEPAGRYMLLRGPWHPKEPQPGFEYGAIRFEKPLVIAFNSDPDPPKLYNETSWKANLSRAYGNKKGRALSRALMKDGYDGIVTVGTDARGRPRDTREIVDLTVLQRRR